MVVRVYVVGTVFMPSHIDMQVIIRYCRAVTFSPSVSITPPLSMNKGFVCLFLELSTLHCYPGFALCFLARTHGCFFHCSLTEEIISDWEQWGRNDKLIYLTSEPILDEYCKPFWFQYAQAGAKVLLPLASTTVQRVLTNVCGCFNKIFNNWYWRITKFAPFTWVHMCKWTFWQ